jgi:hypothetical protein
MKGGFIILNFRVEGNIISNERVTTRNKRTKCLPLLLFLSKCFFTFELFDFPDLKYK